MRILHLSDVHYGYRKAETGNDAKSAHCFVDNGKPAPHELAGILERSPRCENPSVLVVSGDIGWSGEKCDYDYAFEFLNSVRLRWPKLRFVVAPGNHDVNLLDGSAEAEKRQDEFVDFLRKFFGKSFAATYPFVPKTRRKGFRHHIISITRCEDDAIFVAINSAASLNTFQDPVLIDPSVLELVSRTLGPLPQGMTPLRVLVLHHHILPFVEPLWENVIDISEVREKPDNSLVANSARLQAWLSKHHFHLVLHGHKHQFHGREDILWRAHVDGIGRKIVIVGAGSAGVHWDEIGKQVGHSLNVIDIERQDDQRWRLDVTTGQITDRNGPNELVDWFTHKAFVGDLANIAPPFFSARSMEWCHRAIKCQLEGKGAIRNFMSLVETAEYIHPETVRIGDVAVDKDSVENSFIALHPEYHEDDGWNETRKIDRILHGINNTYRIQHGPRLFSKIARFGLGQQLEDTESLRPIRSALAALQIYPTRAYVSLYDPERDVGHNSELLPGLMGIQFLPRSQSKLLDITFFFRNVELSFWWAVNMMEAIRLLKWACLTIGKDTYRPGSITFFSAIAEWRKEPRPMFVSSIDGMREEELFALVIAADAGSTKSVGVLIRKLEEKIAYTSDLNIDCKGLSSILTLVVGILRDRQNRHSITNGSINEAFKNQIQSAVQALQEAIDKRSGSAFCVTKAQESLNEAIYTLKAWLRAQGLPNMV